MKKTVILILALVIFSVKAYALEDFDINSITNESAQSIVEDAENALSVKGISQELAESFRSAFRVNLSKFFSIFAVIILSAVVAVIKEDSFEAGEYVLLLTLSYFVFANVFPMVENVRSALSKICLFMIALTPVMSELTASSGGIAEAAAMATNTSFFLNVLDSVCAYFVIPLCKYVFCFSLLGVVSPGLDFSGVSSFLKKMCNVTLGLLMTLYIGIMYFQKILSTNADNLIFRSARYVSASLVPMVGGMIGESMRTVFVSFSLVRSAAGVMGVASVLSFIIPIIASVVINKMFIVLAAFISKILGLKKQSDFLYDINNCLNILNCAAVCISIGSIVNIGIMIQGRV